VLWPHSWLFHWLSSSLLGTSDVGPKASPFAATRPISPIVIAGPIEVSRYSSTADSLARAESLRVIATLESGRADTPPGTYSWTFASYIAGARDRSDSLGGFRGEIAPSTGSDFRVHHLQSGERLILGFVSADVAAYLFGPFAARG